MMMMLPSFRRVITSLLLSGLLLAAGTISSQASEKAPAKRSWWIDMDRFLSSAHGRFSCSECHPDLHEKEKKHPDPILRRMDRLLGKTRMSVQGKNVDNAP